jgi:hypothetical protein
MKSQYRQGDVLIHPVDAIPPTAKRRRQSCVVLAEGEVTGHAHRIDKPAGKCTPYFEPDGTLYLRVRQPCAVTHEEHGTATLAPGNYVVKRQVEVWLDEIRQVAD